MDCPSCGHHTRDGAKFCDECGAALSGAPGAERRQLTVMFCDLVGSTELAEHLDPEDLRDVVRAYQRATVEAVAPYEGHVAQYLGDGVLVYFGYPRAHEDDGERALRSGLDVLRGIAALGDTIGAEHGISIVARIGVHTGPVVVDEMGAGAKRETLALGDTINIAARLEESAAPGSLVASDATLRLAPGRFLTEAMGALRLKGVADPVLAHTVRRPTGVRSRLDADPDRLTPLVGRESELGTLLDRWQRAEDGEGQAIVISGEAGVGKSRLLRAFRDRLADEAHTWLECSSSPFTQGSAFSPVIDLIRRGLGTTTEDPEEDVLRRLEEAIADAGLDLEQTIPLLAPLLALSLPTHYRPPLFSPELVRRKTIDALAAWAMSLADARPLVVVVEDLHWSDPSTLAFLEVLFEQSASSPIAVVTTFRSEFQPPWPHRSHHTQIALPRLRPPQARRLVRGVLGRRGLPDPWVERIVDRADGVPLFLEELTQSVAESPTGIDAIPFTLQDSLMARLDRLAYAREVAQAGATLGRRFHYLLLRAVCRLDGRALDEGLENLVDAELLVQRGSVPDSTYLFKHALIQDTAYSTLVRDDRRDLHARAASALEALTPDRVAVEPEVLARHHEYAGSIESAVHHYQRAGRRASNQAAYRESILHLSRALELLTALDPTPERRYKELELHMELVLPHILTHGMRDLRLAELATRAEELVSELSDAPLILRFNVWMTLYAYYVLPGGLGLGRSTREALALAEESGDQRAIIAASDVHGDVLFMHGRFAEAMPHLDRAIDLYDLDKHGPLAFRAGMDHGLTAAAYRSSCLWVLGYPERAVRQGEEVIAMAKELGHPFSIAHVHLEATFALWRSGLVEEARRSAREAVRICDRFGFTMYGTWARCYEAALRDDDSMVRSEQEIAGHIKTLDEMGGFVRMQTLAVLHAEVLIRLNRLDEACLAVDQGFEMTERLKSDHENAELYRLRGECIRLRDPADANAAQRAYESAICVSANQQAKSYELRAATGLARLHHARGRSADAKALLAPIYGWFTEGFDTRDLRDARSLLEELG